MAIDLLANPTATAPTALADYQAILTQLVANGQAFTGRLIVQGSNIKAGTVILIGGVLYKATTDTAITGTASSYVKITPSGATASAAFVANLTGVTWNDAYGGYYDGSGNLHVFDEGLAVSSGALASAKTELGYSSGYSYGPRNKTFTASGTFVVPTGVSEVWVTGCAAGGNGTAGDSGGNNGGVGGRMGQFCVKQKVAVTSGASITVTIGAVGANTTFGGSITLGYGTNGGGNSGFLSGSSGATSGLQQGGGGGSSSPIPYTGLAGSAGATGIGAGGSGGVNGGGGGGGGNNLGGAGGAGGAGNNYGAGGGGGGAGVTGGAGGAGGPGIITVEW